MDKSRQIDTFSRFTQVSRETITSLIKYEYLLSKANQKLNLIGKSTLSEIWIRHFLDSFQLIDFIDKNDHSLVDLGSGAGFPGLVIAIASRDRNIPIKIKLIEKSPKKVRFLNEIIVQLNFKVDVLLQDVIKQKIKIEDEVIVARAFKPLEKILALIHKQAKKWKKIFIFLGKTGKNELLQASKSWDIEYKQGVSVTNVDSIIIEINGLKKR